jgi:hypothetical protein
MKWGSPEQVDFLANSDEKISNELRLVMMGILHVDERIGHLQWIAYYASAVLTAILVTLLLR